MSEVRAPAAGAAVSEPVGRHLPPFYCPYCGEERIRPAGQGPGGWACELCRREWRLLPGSGAPAAGPDTGRAGVGTPGDAR